MWMKERAERGGGRCGTAGTAGFCGAPAGQSSFWE